MLSTGASGFRASPVDNFSATAFAGVLEAAEDAADR
jgi:hypothetical protein